MTKRKPPVVHRCVTCMRPFSKRESAEIERVEIAVEAAVLKREPFQDDMVRDEARTVARDAIARYRRKRR